MLVGSYADDQQTISAVDFLEQPLPLARDVFGEGTIRRDTVERIVKILKDFRAALSELGIPDGMPNRVVATNIIAESSNRDAVLNRVQIACGISVEPLDDGEMTRLIYMQSQALLKSVKSLSNKNTLVVHVGPGNTRVLYFSNGNIAQYSSYRLGSFRAYQAIQKSQAKGKALLSMLQQQTRASIDSILFDYQNQQIDQMLVIGHEMQFISPHLSAANSEGITPPELRSFLSKIADMGADKRVKKYHLDYAHADSLIAAVKINSRLAEAFKAERVFIPSDDYETELLANLPNSTNFTVRFQQVVRQSAISIASRYKIDLNHAKLVESLSTTIFDKLAPLHNLGAKERLLLSTAAILHETGNLISASSHHKHSYYIIRHSEIFGLSSKDIEIAGLIARYHRHSMPKPSHEGYKELSRENRMLVSKLAAILRVADALDRTHAQRIQDIDIKLSNQRMRISITTQRDIAIEQLALKEKADLFRDIYGLDASLEAQPPKQF
ncbi:HD domain-containing protein [Persicirhabdus sediminis]|uniref:HD domain-containing protein n=1 Tax=Persicirhabdus sediminis TaxID=454144 RepID=A0A8J7MC66_9BACT|nr:HD domain-containing protein [Persicirhabdus sediminis]MBK1790388.1 HD domain-containing protein [Persicirhabdus sediminis]